MRTHILKGSKHEIAADLARITGDVREAIVFVDEPTPPAAQAGHWLRFFQRRFTLLPDRAELTRLWQALVEACGVTGFRAHDARLVAAMQSYGLTQLLTFNATDFQGLPVTVMDPAAP